MNTSFTSLQRTHRILLITFWLNMAAAAIVAIAGELFDVALPNVGGGNTEFILLTMMELLTIGIIPLALRLFRFAFIKRQIAEKKEKALLKWGACRLDMLQFPLLGNIMFYYLFMHPAFGYLALILLVTLVFVYPTRRRCEEELKA